MSDAWISRDSSGLVNGVAYSALSGFEEVTSATQAELQAFLSPPPPKDYTIPKSLPWRRMTEAEASTVTAAMSQATARQRAIYDAAQEIDTTDELYGILTALLSAALTPSRAEQLLARL